MKFFVVIVLIGTIFSISEAGVTLRHGQTTDDVEGVEHGNEMAQNTGAESDTDTDLIRFRKAAKTAYSGPIYPPPSYGPSATYTYQSPAPTVPCAKNLLFSCQPSVAPVPCAAPGYSSYSAAYSEPIPTYAIPQFRGYIHPYGNYQA